VDKTEWFVSRPTQSPLGSWLDQSYSCEESKHRNGHIDQKAAKKRTGALPEREKALQDKEQGKKDDNAQDWSKRSQVLVMFGWLQGLARAAGLNEDFGIRQAKSSSRRNTRTSRVVWVLCFG